MDEYDWDSWDNEAAQYLDSSGFFGPSNIDISQYLTGGDDISQYLMSPDQYASLTGPSTDQELIDWLGSSDLPMEEQIPYLQQLKLAQGLVEPDAYSKDSPVVSPDEQYRSVASVFGETNANSKSPLQKLLEGRANQALKQEAARQRFGNSNLGGILGLAQLAGLIAQGVRGPAVAKVEKRPSTVAVSGPTYQRARAPRTLYAKGGKIELPSNVKGGLTPIALKIVEHIASQKGLIGGDEGGQDDVVDIKAAPGEYVMDAETVSALGDGNNTAGAKKLDEMRYNIRKHKRSGALEQIAPKSKNPEHYMKGKKHV